MNPNLTIALSNAIKQGQDATVWAQVTVTAADAPAHKGAERKPLDLYLVIDRSSSMAEQAGSSTKIENARAAVAYVLSQLGGNDRASIISYDSTVDVITELSSDHQEAARRVKSINPRGMTALAPALYQAVDSAREHATSERSAHVFLLSDGQANVGDQDPEVIATRIADHVNAGVRVSTFGLGDDYNEELMEQIAVAGQGGYHYLASADDAPGAFAKELDELMRVTLREAVLTLTPAYGISVEGLLGTDATVGETITLGDVPAGATRMILAKLRVRAGKVPDEILSVQLTGRTGLDGQGKAELTAPATVLQFADDAQVAGAVNVAVLARVAELEAAQAQREAAAAADRSDYDLARRLLADTRVRVAGALAMAGDDLMLQAKLGQIDRNIQSVADDRSYTSGMSKSMKFASYATRTSRG